MREDWYDVAQICLSGHVINNSVKEYPENNKKYCDKCGAATITNCLNCNAEIQGYYNVEGVISVATIIQPHHFVLIVGNRILG